MSNPTTRPNGATQVFLLIGGIVLLVGGIAFTRIRFDYTLITVALGGGILGAFSGVLGSFSVLKRESLLGDALSHAALPGVCLSFLVAGRELPALLIGAGLAGWLGMLLIRAISNTTRINEETAMGIILVSFFAFGIALLSYIQQRPDASQAGLDKFIFGQAAAMVRRDVWVIGAVGVGVCVALLAFWKEFELVTFDREFALANGYPVRLIELLLISLTVVAIVLGLQLAGVVLMVGLLIAPGVAARQLTRNLAQMVLLSGVFGGIAGTTGAVLSALGQGLPTGPLIILVASAIVFTVILFAPQRGIVWMTLQQRRNRLQLSMRHILRDVYRYALEHGGERVAIPEPMLRALRGREARLGVRLLEQQGLLESLGAGWRLTAEGLQLIERDERNQKLWRAFRVYSLQVDTSLLNISRDADLTQTLPLHTLNELEHILENGS